MTTEYVDTDDSTSTETGSQTEPYKKLSTAFANLPTLSGEHLIICRGTLDDTQVTVSSSGATATNYIRVKGALDADWSGVDDGQYLGPDANDADYYMIRDTGGFHAIYLEEFVEIEGIQAEAAQNSAFVSTVRIAAKPNCHIFDCRIRYDGGNTGADGIGFSGGDLTDHGNQAAWGGLNVAGLGIVNNIVQSDGAGIFWGLNTVGWDLDATIVGNTIWAAGGQGLVDWTATVSAGTVNYLVANNSVPNASGTSIVDYSTKITASGTQNQRYNAHKNGESTVGTGSVAHSSPITSDFVSAGIGVTANFTPVNGGAIYAAGLTSDDVIGTGIDGVTRKATNCDMGAIELAAAGSTGTNLLTLIGVG